MRSVVLVLAAAVLLGGCLRPAPQDRPLATPFEVETIDGGSFSLRQERGNVVLLDFMATWCEPCRRQIPEFEEVRASLAGRGFVALSLDVDPLETAEDLARFRDSVGADWPFALDTVAARVHYDAVTLPKQVLVDREGRIAWETAPGQVVDGARLAREAARLLDEPAAP